MKTLVIHNSGLLNSGPTTMTGASVGKEVLQTLHTPVIYIEGGPTDIAYENGMDDFKRIPHVPAAIANLPVGHGGTFNEPNGGAAASVAVSWLNWQLRGDARVPSGLSARTAACARIRSGRCQLYDVGPDYLVMSTWRTPQRANASRRAVQLAVQIADALAAAHARASSIAI